MYQVTTIIIVFITPSYNIAYVWTCADMCTVEGGPVHVTCLTLLWFMASYYNNASIVGNVPSFDSYSCSYLATTTNKYWYRYTFISYANVLSMKWNTIKIDTRIFVTFWIQSTWAVADDERSDNCFLSRLSWLLIRLLLLVRSNLLKMTNMTFLLSSSPEMLLDKMQLNVAVSVSDVFKTYKYNYQWGF